MEIENLTYKQFSMIREAVMEKREKLWKETHAIPYKKEINKMSIEEISGIKRKFDTTTNQFREWGVCNVILRNLEKMEEGLVIGNIFENPELMEKAKK